MKFHVMKYGSLLSEKDTADQSITQEYETAISNEFYKPQGASTTRNLDSFHSVCPRNRDLETLDQFLAVSVPQKIQDKQSNKLKIRHHEATRRFALRTGAANTSRRHFDSIESCGITDISTQKQTSVDQPSGAQYSTILGTNTNSFNLDYQTNTMRVKKRFLTPLNAQTTVGTTTTISDHFDNMRFQSNSRQK